MVIFRRMSEERLRRTEGPRPRAVIVGVQLPEASDDAFEASLVELGRLADTLGLEVVARITQRRAALAPAAVLGEGKLRELAAFTGGTGVVPAYVKPGKGKAEAEDDEDDDAGSMAVEGADAQATVVLIDHDLTPSQMRNLEKATDAEVLDRTSVILAIFQRHARTREAKMQVEIARLAYAAPRLREAGAGQDRQRGGVGGKGAGESSLELDRRKIRDRIAELRRELENVQRDASTRRGRRTESYTVALVGYTNAGKSSLMRALTSDEVYVADQLFATLDTTVRVLKPEVRPRILVSDTVGFIKKLPHDLVASFRSTLEEAKDASLLLHLVDAADPAFRDQYSVTRTVLEEIGAGDGPSLLVLNKADRLTPEQHEALAAEFPEAVIMSARSKADVATLHARIVSRFEEDMEEDEFLIPYAEQRHVATLHERTRVVDEHYGEDGTRMRVRASAAILGSVRREIRGDAG
jgi:GTP-binding protein HflX